MRGARDVSSNVACQEKRGHVTSEEMEATAPDLETVREHTHTHTSTQNTPMYAV